MTTRLFKLRMVTVKNGHRPLRDMAYNVSISVWGV